MKKIVIIVAFLFLKNMSNAQNTFPASGNVGIGTTTPHAKLHIYGNSANTNNLILSANYQDRYRWRLNTLDRGYAIDLDFTSSNDSDTEEKVLTLSRSTSTRPEFQLYNNAIVANDGKIGIGTATPQAKLDIDFGGEPKSIKFLEFPNNVSSMNSLMRFTWYNDTADFGMIRSGSTPIEGLAIRFNEVEKVRFTPTGNMSVQGKLEAKEIKVTNSPTADFVFEATYNLPKLEDVEKHIKEKKHLPEIASAKQMEKEGVNVGEFQIKLLQKIEELTLYTIEQNKQLQEQNKLFLEQQKEINTLKEELRKVKRTN